METTAIHINSKLYNDVADYARRHNTDIGKMTESYFISLLTPQVSTAHKEKELPASFKRLRGMASHTQQEIAEDERLSYILSK